MPIKSILVVIPPGAPENARLDMAFALAKSQDATVLGLLLVPTITTFAGAPGAGLPSPGSGQGHGFKEGARAIEEMLREKGSQMQVAVEWLYEEGDEIAVAGAQARYADLLVVEPDLARDLVFTGGVPVLAVPDDVAAVAPKRVLIAWSGSREAARAVRDALPLILAAEAVVAVSVDPPDGRATGHDLAGFLGRHGARIETRHRSSDDTSAGAMLLNEAKAMGADLLVMGAYGHSRFREWILGGATDEVLAETRIPVFLSH